MRLGIRRSIMKKCSFLVLLPFTAFLLASCGQSSQGVKLKGRLVDNGKPLSFQPIESVNLTLVPLNQPEAADKKDSPAPLAKPGANVNKEDGTFAVAGGV